MLQTQTQHASMRVRWPSQPMAVHTRIQQHSGSHHSAAARRCSSFKAWKMNNTATCRAGPASTSYTFSQAASGQKSPPACDSCYPMNGVQFSPPAGVPRGRINGAALRWLRRSCMPDALCLSRREAFDSVSWAPGCMWHITPASRAIACLQLPPQLCASWH